MDPVSLFFLFVMSILSLIGVVALTQGRRRSITDGRRLLDQGDAEGARKVFERMARQRSKLAPGREPALFWLGMTLEELGRVDDARRVYQRYLIDYDTREGPRPTPQVIARVRERLQSLLATEEAGPGRHIAASGAELEPTPDVRFLGLPDARRYLERREYEKARVVLEHLISERPQPGSLLFVFLGQAYEGLGRPDDARRVYLRLRETHARGPGFALEAARMAEERLKALDAGAGAGEPPRSAWERFQREVQRRQAELAGAVKVVPVGKAALPSELSTPLPVPLDAVRKDLLRLDAGARVGGFVLAEKLGEGGMGEVFRALRPVAIKFARTPEAVEHLRRFGTLQSQIQSSRIVRPLQIDLESDPPYVVMEYVDGPTLREVLRARAKLEPALAVHVLSEVAHGLADAHRAGVLHLDLKPENVLLDVTGAVKLTDFELGESQAEASQLRLSLSFHSAADAEGIGGTLAYMSPEQRAGKVPDGRSDIYTFGVLLFEALTGTLPEPGDRPSDFVAGLPPEVDQVFERCFARLERRYADAAELAREVERVRQKLGAKVDLARIVAQVPRKVTDGVVPRALERSTSERLRRQNQVDVTLEAVERATAESGRRRAQDAAAAATPTPAAAGVTKVEPEPVRPPEAVKPPEAVQPPEAVKPEAVIAPPALVVDVGPPELAKVEPVKVEPVKVEPVKVEATPTNGEVHAGPAAGAFVRPPIEELVRPREPIELVVPPAIRAPIDEALAARAAEPPPVVEEPVDDEPDRPQRVAERS